MPQALLGPWLPFFRQHIFCGAEGVAQPAKRCTQVSRRKAMKMATPKHSAVLERMKQLTHRQQAIYRKSGVRTSGCLT